MRGRVRWEIVFFILAAVFFAATYAWMALKVLEII